MAEDKNRQDGDTFHPKGTMLIMILFLITIIVLWGSVYLILLSRGVTL